MTVTSAEMESTYLASSGVRCPWCASDDLSAGPLRPHGIVAYGDVQCGACGAAWQDVYRLTGIIDLALPAGGQDDETLIATASG